MIYIFPSTNLMLTIDMEEKTQENQADRSQFFQFPHCFTVAAVALISCSSLYNWLKIADVFLLLN